MTAQTITDFEMRERPCPTCGVDDYRILGLRGGEHHRYKLGVATRIVQCARCALVFPNPFPYARAPSEVYGDPDKYFAHLSTENLDVYRRTIREARGKVQAAAPRLLDVGCGLGQYLRAADLEGLRDMVGLEISQATADSARARLGVDVVCQKVEDYAAGTEARFDIVLLSAVLEHVYEPDVTIAAISRLMNPGGILYIDVPCEPSLLTMVGNTANRLRGRQTVLNLSPTWPPYHVFGFNRRALERLLGKHQLRLESLEIWADPKIPAASGIKDRLRALVGTQINRFANLLRLSGNMSGWARRT